MTKLINVVIRGYGIITDGIIKRLKSFDEKYQIYLVSEHFNQQIENIKIFKSLEELDDLIQYDIILSSFRNVEDSERFWTSQSFLKLFKNKKIHCIETSTLSYNYIIKWGSYISQIGCIPVEAPLTGSKMGSLNGKLSFFLFFEAEKNELNNLLSDISLNQYRFKTLGEATKFKLVYNTWGAFLLYSIKIFLPYLIKSNDFDIISKIICNDGWMSKVCEGKLKKILTNDYEDVSFSLNMMNKDINYFLKIYEVNNLSLKYIIDDYLSKESECDFSIISKLE